MKKNKIILILGLIILLTLNVFGVPTVSNVNIESNDPFDVLNGNLTCNYQPNVDTTDVAISWNLNGINIYDVHYPFLGGSTNALLDLSGNENNLTNNGNVVYNSTGSHDSGSHFEFNDNGFLTLDNDMTITKNDFAVSFWFRTRVENLAGDSIFAVDDGGNSFIPRLTNGDLRLCIGACDQGSTRIDDELWHFVTIIGNGSAVNLYLDGNTTPENTLNSDSGDINQGVAVIGANQNGSTDFLDGEIADFIVHDKEISLETMIQLYNNTYDVINSIELNYNDNYTCTVTPFNESFIGTSITSDSFNVVNETLVNGSCGISLNTCDAGNFSDLLDNRTHQNWECLGIGGGNNVSCSLERELSAYGQFSDNIPNITDLVVTDYQTLYTITETFGNSFGTTTIYISMVGERVLAGTDTDIYMRLVVDGVPQPEKLIGEIDINNVKKNLIFQDSLNLVNDTYTIDVQLRKTGSAKLDFTNNNFNLYSTFTNEGLLFNGVGLVLNETIIGDGTYKNISNFTLPFDSTGNIYVGYVGTIINSLSPNQNNVSLRFTDGDNFTDVITISVYDSVDNIYYPNLMLDSSSQTFTLQAKGNENFDLLGNVGYVDYVDTSGATIPIYPSNNISVPITNLTLVNDTFIIGSSVGYLQDGLESVDFNIYVKDLNTSTYFYSDIVETDFTSEGYGLINQYFQPELINLDNTYEIGVNFTSDGLGEVDYFSLVGFQGYDINYTSDTVSNITVVLDQSNNTYISSITGSCEANTPIISVNINDSDFIYSGSVENFNFTYTGNSNEFINVNVTCRDIYFNEGNVQGTFKFDNSTPTCNGVGDQVFEVLANVTEIKDIFNITCSDVFELESFNLSCDNGFNHDQTISGESFNYTSNVTFEDDMACNLIVTDEFGNDQPYNFTYFFTISDEPVLKTRLDVDGRLNIWSCPTNHIQYGTLVGLFILAFAFYGLGFKFNNTLRPFFLCAGGLMMGLLPFYIIGCDLVLAIMVWMGSAAMLLSSILVPYEKKDDDDF